MSRFVPLSGRKFLNLDAVGRIDRNPADPLELVFHGICGGELGRIRFEGEEELLEWLERFVFNGEVPSFKKKRKKLKSDTGTSLQLP